MRAATKSRPASVIPWALGPGPWALSLGHQPRDQIDQHSGQPTDKRSIVSDELQITPDRQLDALGRDLRIPAAHRLRNQVCNIVLIPGDEEHRSFDDEVVDLLHQLRILEHGFAEYVERALDRAPLRALLVLGITDERRTRVVPER